MLTILVCVLLFFRWQILERFIGTIRMFLFDALLFTVLAAINFANPGVGGWLIVSYVIGGLCIFWGIQAARKYLMYSEIQRIENDKGKGKSDDGTASGS